MSAPKSSSATPAAAKPAWWTLLAADVRSVKQRDPAARSLLEAWTIYPGVHALLCHRIAHALWLHGWHFAARWISFAARWWTQVDIHPGATIGAGLFIDHGCGVVIGETAEIGNDVTLYHGVTLGGTSWRSGKRHPTLGDHVVVGAGAKILGAITVGEGARIAANSVVIEPVPVGATVVGIPGRVVGRERASTHGFDLDHHLIPDPVGKAIACLLERVAQLESARSATALATLGAPTGSPDTVRADTACADSACGDCAVPCTTPPFHSLLSTNEV